MKGIFFKNLDDDPVGLHVDDHRLVFMTLPVENDEMIIFFQPQDGLDVRLILSSQRADGTDIQREGQENSRDGQYEPPPFLST
jgi:hypothetical protein